MYQVTRTLAFLRNEHTPDSRLPVLPGTLYWSTLVICIRFTHTCTGSVCLLRKTEQLLVPGTRYDILVLSKAKNTAPSRMYDSVRSLPVLYCSSWELRHVSLHKRHTSMGRYIDSCDLSCIFCTTTLEPVYSSMHIEYRSCNSSRYGYARYCMKHTSTWYLDHRHLW